MHKQDIALLASADRSLRCLHESHTLPRPSTCLASRETLSNRSAPEGPPPRASDRSLEGCFNCVSIYGQVAGEAGQRRCLGGLERWREGSRSRCQMSRKNPWQLCGGRQLRRGYVDLFEVASSGSRVFQDVPDWWITETPPSTLYRANKRKVCRQASPITPAPDSTVRRSPARHSILRSASDRVRSSSKAPISTSTNCRKGSLDISTLQKPDIRTVLAHIGDSFQRLC